MKTSKVKQAVTDSDGVTSSVLSLSLFVKGKYRGQREREDDTELRRKEGPTSEA